MAMAYLLRFLVVAIHDTVVLCSTILGGGAAAAAAAAAAAVLPHTNIFPALEKNLSA